MYDRDAHAMICGAYSRQRAWLKAVSAFSDPGSIVPSVFRSTMDFLALASLVRHAPFFETFMAFAVCFGHNFAAGTRNLRFLTYDYKFDNRQR